MSGFRPYAARTIRPMGLRQPRDWRLKLYAILFETDRLDLPGFASGLELAEAELPEPAVTAARPGVGFLIAHQGRTAWYVVLGWWDRENELPLRVFVRDAGGGWRPARGSESVCVWDLQVIGFERDAYVATLLAGGADPAAAADTYLGHRLEFAPVPA